MAAAEVDLAYLSSHAGVPEADLDTAVSAPTADLVASVLGAIVTKLRDLEQDKFQLGVELEAAFRGAESRCEQFKGTSDKALKEVEELRQKLQNEGKSPFAISMFCLAMSANMLSTQKMHAGLSRMNSRPSNLPGQHHSRKSRRSGRALPLSRPQTARP
jgi:hypothetical protein